MKVTMLEDRRGSSDGVHVELHEAGTVVDVSDDLGAVYVREGWATVDAPKAERAPATRAPRNSARTSPSRRK